MLDKFFSYPQYVPRPPGFGLRQVHVIGIHHHIEVSTLAISIATKQIYIYLEKTLTSKSSASAFSDSEHSELHLFEVCEFIQVSHMDSHGFTWLHIQGLRPGCASNRTWKGRVSI